MKTRVYVIALLAISATMLILSTNSAFVFADPCTATLSYPVIPAQYSNSNPIVVPISASCSTYYGNQLYATGSAQDLTSNVGLGSASTILSPVNGGTEFTGQLGFSSPPTSPGDSVQISVSIYNGQYGSQLTETSETFQVGGELQQAQQVTTTTVTENENSYYNSYPTAYPQQPNQYYQYQPQHQNHHQTHYFSQILAQNSNNTNLFDYVVIVAILAAVIIATAGLVLVARRQPSWPQPQQPVPR